MSDEYEAFNKDEARAKINLINQLSGIRMVAEVIADGHTSHDSRDTQIVFLMRLVRSLNQSWQRQMLLFLLVHIHQTELTHSDVKSLVRLFVAICDHMKNKVEDWMGVLEMVNMLKPIVNKPSEKTPNMNDLPF